MTWFLAAHLLIQSKNGISALNRKLQLGVRYNTAWSVQYKLMQTMRERAIASHCTVWDWKGLYHN